MAEVADKMVVEGDQDDKGVRSSVDTQCRKKRHRQRRKRKLGRQQPYAVPTAPRGKRALTASVRAQEVRNEMFTHGQPVAPYNTTQFLIEDHGDLHDFDAQLSKAPDSHRRSRTRDSSFSVDSDDNFYYSSPEDEEEFLTKEFSLEYQDLHVERLNSLSKADIIHDYLMLENKYEKSMIELRKLKADSGRDTDASSRSEADVNEQLRLATSENRKLKAELEKLKRERSLGSGGKMRRRYDSSEDSESDSTSSSSMEDIGSADSAPSSPAVPQDSQQQQSFVMPDTPATSTDLGIISTGEQLVNCSDNNKVRTSPEQSIDETAVNPEPDVQIADKAVSVEPIPESAAKAVTDVQMPGPTAQPPIDLQIPETAAQEISDLHIPVITATVVSDEPIPETA